MQLIFQKGNAVVCSHVIKRAGNVLIFYNFFNRKFEFLLKNCNTKLTIPIDFLTQ